MAGGHRTVPGQRFLKGGMPVPPGFCSKSYGFTLIELIIVLFLITLILGLSAMYFSKSLSSSRLSAAARELSSSIKYAGTISRTEGVDRTITIGLDTGTYRLDSGKMGKIPEGVHVKVIDPLTGEIVRGDYSIIFHAEGGVEGGTVVLWNEKRTVNIQLDPVVGAVVIK